MFAVAAAFVGCTRDEWQFRPRPAGDASVADANDASVDAPDDAPASRGVSQVATYGLLTYAVLADGSVHVTGEWAGAFEGVEGAHRNHFVRVEGLDDVVEVSSASQSPAVLCARHRDGSVRCKEGSTAPAEIAGLRAVQIAGRCARREDGTVTCWDLAALRATPIDLTGVTAIAGNGRLHCAIRDDHGVWCWGELATILDVAPGTPTTTPVQVPRVAGAFAIAVGQQSACAAINAGNVLCWGRRSIIDGGPDALTATPVAIPNATRVRSLTPNSALTEEGRVLTWGGGLHGTAGNNTYPATPGATVVPGLFARSIADGDGDRRVCAVDRDGAAWCWGQDDVGELGVRGGVELSPLPVLADPLVSETALLEDVRDTMMNAEVQCALLGSGGVFCFGGDSSGGNGNGVVDRWPSHQIRPTPVAGLAGVAALVGGGSTQNETFGVVLGDRTTRLWGTGSSGLLGDGTTSTRARPGAPAGLAPVERLVMGESHACALLRDGTVSCWGVGTSGQLGDGRATSSATPVAVAGLADVVDLAVSTDSSVALLRDGSMRLWGRGTGLLSPMNRPAPVVLPAPDGAADLAMLSPHNFRQLCARRADGRVSCFGQNLPAADRWVDMGLEGVTQISASASGSACVRHADGGASCWGVNRAGELGDPSLSNVEGYHPPSRVRLEGGAPLDRVERVRTGIGINCAVRDDRTLWCWGAVNHGSTGRGRTIMSPLPRRVVGL